MDVRGREGGVDERERWREGWMRGRGGGRGGREEEVVVGADEEVEGGVDERERWRE